LAHREENIPEHSVDEQEDIFQYPLQDVLDAVIYRHGECHGTDLAIRQIAEWSSDNDQTSYVLMRTDTYIVRNGRPAPKYSLTIRSFPDYRAWTEYCYNDHTHATTKVIGTGKESHEMGPDVRFEFEMHDHLMTAGVDPGEFLITPTTVEQILKEIRRRDFGWRYRIQQRFRNVVNWLPDRPEN